MKWIALLFCIVCPLATINGLTPTNDPWLLTPGPLTTSPEVKEAMLHDYGSRDPDFIRINRSILDRLLDIVNGQDTFACVPLQGCGTFVVEAMLRTFVPKTGCVLILANGVYGKRMAKICELIPRSYQLLEFPDNQPVDPAAVQQALFDNPEISHVAVVYCETTTGLLNPIAKIAGAVQKADRKLLIDAMSAFGALPLDCSVVNFDGLAFSSNKCLQGVPGVGFCIARKTSLQGSEGNAGSLSFDLFEQWKEMEKSGQWRFTPPTHALLACHKALEQLDVEGGVVQRYKRYQANMETLRSGMSALGFVPYLPSELQAPIIATFLKPADPRFDFLSFYNRLKDKGFVIYPGKLTQVDTFRIGCIGDIDQETIHQALEAIEQVLRELNLNLKD